MGGRQVSREEILELDLEGQAGVHSEITDITNVRKGSGAGVGGMFDRHPQSLGLYPQHCINSGDTGGRSSSLKFKTWALQELVSK